MSELLQAGPCAVCGLRNYRLSFGGPTICPACDCGDSGPSRINAQRRRIEELEARVALYDELLYCVGNKYPGESRHETAKRYLLDREKFGIGDGAGKTECTSTGGA